MCRLTGPFREAEGVARELRLGRARPIEVEPAELLGASPSLQRVALSNPVGGTIVDQASRARGLEGVRGCILGFLARVTLSHIQCLERSAGTRSDDEDAPETEPSRPHP